MRRDLRGKGLPYAEEHPYAEEMPNNDSEKTTVLELTVECHDTVAASLRRITALASLLGAISEGAISEGSRQPLDGEVVGEAADMIAEQAA